MKIRKVKPEPHFERFIVFGWGFHDDWLNDREVFIITVFNFEFIWIR